MSEAETIREAVKKLDVEVSKRIGVRTDATLSAMNTQALLIGVVAMTVLLDKIDLLTHELNAIRQQG